MSTDEIQDAHRLGTTGLAPGRFVAGLPALLPVRDGVAALRDGWQLGARSLDVPLLPQGESAAERFLDDVQPAECVIFTALGAPVDPGRGSDLSPERLDSDLASAVLRLGRVDAAWLRGTDAETPLEASITRLAAAIEAGRIRCWGLSGVAVRDLDAALAAADRAGLPRPVFVRNRLNLLAHESERDVLALAAGEGIAVTPVAPFAGGRLTEESIAEQEAEEREVAGGAERRRDPDPALPRLIELRARARERDLTVQALALAWLLAHPQVTAPIVAVRTRADWDAVALALESPLDEELYNRLT